MEIASAFVSVMPSMRGFRRAVTSEAEQSGDAASRGFGRRFGSRVGSEGKRLGSAFGKAFAVGATVAVGAGLGFAKAAISEAADLEQSVGAIETVFKRSSGQMLTWSKNAAKAVGLSKNEFNELGTLIGSQLKNGGTAMDRLAPKTNKLITLGADLSSMFGGTTREAVEALSSALKGERDPIEKYGVSLNQAKIDAEATALGFKKVGNSFDTQAQQAATLSLIYKQTSDAQGNFGRETDTTAHKQQVLAARFDNLKARVGKGLLPVYNKLLDFTEQRLGPAFRSVAKAVTPVIQAIGDRLAPVIERATDFMRKNPAVVKAFAIALGVLAAAIGVVTLATTAFSIALNSTGIPLVIIAIAGLVAGLVYAYQHSEQFRAIVDKIGASLRLFAAWVRDEVVPVIVDLAQKVATNLQPVWQALVEFFTASVLPMVDKAAAKFREWQPTIQRIAGIVVMLAAKWIDFYTTMLGKVLPVIIKVAGFILRNFGPALIGMVGQVGRIIGVLVSLGHGFANAGKAVGDFARKVAEKISDVTDRIAALPGQAKSALGNIGAFLYDSGRALIQGFVDGIKSMASPVMNAVSWVVDKANDFVPHSPVKKGPLTKWNKGKPGKTLMEMLASGIRKGASAVVSATENVANSIDKVMGKKGGIGKKLGKRIKEIASQIGRAAQGLQDAMQARNDLAGSVASNLMGEFSLSDLFGKNQFGLSLGLDSAVQAAQAIVGRMRAFASKLTALVASGLPPALVQEIAGLGSLEGTRVADAFLQGGSFLQSQFKAAYGDLQAVTGAAGLTVGNATFGQDIQAASDVLAAAIKDGLSKLGLSVTVGVGKEASLQIVQQGTTQAKKRGKKSGFTPG